MRRRSRRRRRRSSTTLPAKKTTPAAREREREREMLEAKSVVKASVPSTLIQHPSPGSTQSTRLALQVDEKGSSCWVYIASGCHVYQVQVPLDEALISKGKESLLIPAHTQVTDSKRVKRCPHRSEIQSLALTESDSMGYSMLGSVDSYGRLIVSKLDASGQGAGYCLVRIWKREKDVQ